MKKINFNQNLSILDDATISAGPQNNGSLTSRAAFVQETLYQTRAYDNSFSMFNVGSVRYENQHYGRINNKLLSILPFDFLTETIGENVSVLSFVAEAYKAFFLNLQLLKQRGSIPKKSVAYNFEAKSPAEEIDALYFSFLSSEYDLFLNFMEVGKYDKNVTNFESFIDVFSKFVNTRTPLVPFLKSSFVKSKYVPNNISGLYINLSEEDDTNDQIKYNKFIKDPGFKCYLDLAKEYGFFVNKDKPWQIVADLDSVNMKYYFMLKMKKYKEQGLISQSPINLESSSFEDSKAELEIFNLKKFLFEKNSYLDFFSVVNSEDVKSLKRFVGRFYNSYCQYKENISSIEVVTNKLNQIKVKKTVSKRQQINVLNLVNEEDNKYWLRLYTFIKARENNVNWDQSKFDFVSKKMEFLYSSLDILAAMEYLEKEINTVEISGRKNRNYKL